MAGEPLPEPVIADEPEVPTGDDSFPKPQGAAVDEPAEAAETPAEESAETAEEDTLP